MNLGRQERPAWLRVALTEMMSEVAASPLVGVDVVDVAGWERCVHRGGERLLTATYRERELEFSMGRIERLATRLAGKEAVLKALGTGVRGVGLRDVEIVAAANGRPSVRLHGPASQMAQALAVQQVGVSLSHEAGLAAAVALAHRQPRLAADGDGGGTGEMQGRTSKESP